jgi:YihY family inner membrane protein
MPLELRRRSVDFVRRLLTQPIDELTRWQRTLRFALDLARYCAKKLVRDRAKEMAAALTYHTLFSLLPTLAMSLALLVLFVGPEERRQFQDRVVDLMLPPSSSSVAPLPGLRPPDAAADGSELDEAREEIRRRVESLSSSLEGLPFKRIGFLGLLLFVYASTALLASIERSFNAIYGTDSQRPWYLRLPLYYTVITLGPLALMGGIALQGRALDWLAAEQLTAWLAGPIFVLSPVLAAWLLLFLMFVLLPTARVSRTAAAAGSLVSAILWVLGKELFGAVIFALYAQGTAAKIFGSSLFVVLAFLFWLWLTWVVVLFGLELTATIQALHGGGLDHLPEFAADRGFVDLRWVIPLAALIAQRFGEGEIAETDELAEALSIPRRPVRQLLETLDEAGLVHRVEERKRSGWSLARPAASVTVGELLGAVRPLLPRAPGGEAAESARRLMTELPPGEAERTLDQLLA